MGSLMYFSLSITTDDFILSNGKRFYSSTWKVSGFSRVNKSPTLLLTLEDTWALVYFTLSNARLCYSDARRVGFCRVKMRPVTHEKASQIFLSS